MIAYNCMYCSILQRMCKVYLLCQVLTLNRKKLLTMRQIQFGQMSKEGMANGWVHKQYIVQLFCNLLVFIFVASLHTLKG